MLQDTIFQDLHGDGQTEKSEGKEFKGGGVPGTPSRLKQSKSLLEHTPSTGNGGSLAGKRFASASTASAAEDDTGVSRCGTHGFFKITF